MKIMISIFDGIGVNLGPIALNFKKPTKEQIAEWSGKANDREDTNYGVIFFSEGRPKVLKFCADFSGAWRGDTELTYAPPLLAPYIFVTVV